MAGNGTLTDKGFTIKPKKLKGATLAEVDVDRKKNGMVDPNDKSQKFYGATDVTIELKIGTEVWYPGGMHILNFKVVLMPQLLAPEVIVSSVINVCVPDKLGGMSAKAKKEWARFYKALVKHEKEHVADGKKLAEEMLKEMAGLSVTLKSESVNEAHIKKESLKLLAAEATKKFGGGEIKKRVNERMKKLDSVNGHGAVHLDRTIP